MEEKDDEEQEGRFKFWRAESSLVVRCRARTECVLSLLILSTLYPLHYDILHLYCNPPTGARGEACQLFQKNGLPMMRQEWGGGEKS